MFNPLIDMARSALTSNPGILALAVAGMGAAFAIVVALARRSRGSGGDGWEVSPSFGQEGTAGELPETPSASGRATSGPPPMNSLRGRAVPARRKRRRGIPVIVGIGVLAAGGWAGLCGMQEIARRDSPGYREKAAFDACFEEARSRPVHEVVATPDAINRSAFTITKSEIRGDYLIKTIFHCYISGGGWVKSRTISVHDRTMKRIGKPDTLDGLFISFAVEADENGLPRTQELLDDLADGAVDFAWNDDAIDRHLRSVKTALEQRKAGAADKAAAYARRAKGDG